MSEDWYEVVVSVQQVGITKVKASSQEDAEDKLDQFSSKYNILSDEEKLLLPNLPFEFNQLIHSEVEVNNNSLINLIPKDHSCSLKNEIKNSNDNELKNLMSRYENLSEEVVQRVRKPKEQDISNPKEFLNISKNFKK